MFLIELALPLPVLSAGNDCQMKAEDTIAGLGSQLTITDCKGLLNPVTITIQPPQGSASTVNAALSSQGSASVFIPGKSARTAGTYTVTAGTEKTTFQVLPDVMSTAHSTLTDDGQTVTLTLLDQYRNPVSAHPIALIASRDTEIVPLTKETDENGTMLWTVRSQGSVTLTTYDILSGKTIASVQRGSSSPFKADLGTSGQGDITFSAIDHFDVALTKDVPVKVNDAVSITITALDRQNRIVEDFVGTLEFSSSDNDADFPSGSGFRPEDLGKRSFPLAFTFRSTGTQTLKVRAKDNTAVVGTMSVVVTGGSDKTGGAIQILDPKQNAYVNKTEILVQGKAPSLINVVVIGGQEQATGSTDAEGVFRVNVKLNPNQRDQTLLVQSENKQYQSLPLHIILSMTGAVVQSISLDPDPGKENQNATITVVSDPGLADVIAHIGSESVTLKEETAGTYTDTFTAPAQGNYDVQVIVTDQAGNETKTFAKWTVGNRSMPIVTGVKAQSLPQAVTVSWQPVDSVSNTKLYRIYVAPADDPGNILYQLETTADVQTATIKGLETGKQYLFSLTAVGQKGEESPERSETAQASPIGLNVTAVPGDASVMLNLIAPPSLSLLKYRVEIGTEPGVYPIRLNFEPAQTIKIPDLINGIAYEMKITPILLNGTEAKDLATTIHATPNGSGGFRPGSGDPISGGTSRLSSSSSSHPAAGYPPPPLSIVEPGIPLMALGALLAIAGVICLFYWQHRRQQTKMQDFLTMMDIQYHR